MPIAISLLMLFMPLIAGAQIDGEKLFKVNCSACHLITEKKLIGPGLAGVEQRWEDKELLYKWIKNSSEVLASGDAYSNALFEEYNKSIMPAQNVNTEEIDAILAYINAGPVAAAPVAADAGGAAVPVEEAPTVPYWVVLLGVLILLIILISMLRNLKYALLKIKSEKEGTEYLEQPSMLGASLSWIGRNKTFFAIILIVFTVGLSHAAWTWLLNVGIYQTYAPEQPIRFSHKVHAGTQKIDCNYCHSAARNSKSAGIPSTNVCMNCHTYIQEGPTYGTEEISKIYAANGYDPAAQAYTAEAGGPVKWVKVHNLPDHAYFNHSQHVTVGKVACQTCHGPVEEMDVVEQFAPLTMGWCVNCHRDTKVNTEGNEYYDEIHSRMPESMKNEVMKDGKIVVSELGGIECAKCHY